ncbi:cyclic nucleotide-binding domain-containing protein [Synechococcales cyanobacterium C]|uniref:Cyclic nucleotide-binding domain-containing protein n=1 Tax=Petrachloros mirabilis ULC683 TaxID=2781853 RepID=A0A8K1ZYY0_9CYAN|nr:cyclic nucleotide-binding domain-containing protein [Petrachloros mirabilis]NCJ06407.1 cyclic nucleotide-binding domain-containing protein [Petrachloros mirabilis ULC683]
MNTPEAISLVWLQERSALGQLSRPVLAAIAPQLEIREVAANRRLVLEDTPPDALYILRTGRLESYRTSPTGSAQATSLLPGSVIHLTELLLDQPAARTVITLTDCELGVLPKEAFLELAAAYPELAQAVSRQLAAELQQVSSQLAFEQERQAVLRPYLVPRVKHGIVGTSRYAVKLRQQIKQAARDRQPVLIFGEPGLEKDNIAALIHFGSPWRREPIIKVNCGTLQASGADLWGRGGGKPGLLEALGDGTLVLNNIQELPSELLPGIKTLLETQTYSPVSRDPNLPVEVRQSTARIIIVTEKVMKALSPFIQHSIKVPPLRIRKADIKVKVDYYLSLIAQSKGFPRRGMTPEALRRLQTYAFPGNVSELQSLVERAVAQAPSQGDLTEELFWPSGTKKQRFRWNLLNAYPWLRRFLRSDWWPTRINYGFTLALFAFVVGILFVGPQSRDQNFALNLFWAWWWPLVLIGFPFVGRLWCAICPFMIYGEVAQKLSLWLVPRELKRWPRHSAEQWGGWFLLGLFALIFLWEELWDLQNTAYLSSWLLLLITGGAVIGSVIFERRFWCRYLCPIGGMNGLFAKLSMTELRAQQGTCSAECTTYQCYKGGPQKGEGLETEGCPLYSHPAQLEDNRDCVLCMTCLKACPHRSVELNLRPPGIELWTTHQPRSYEVALLMLLLGGIFLHRLPELQAWLGVNLHLEQFGIHAAVSVGVLAIAPLLPLIAHGFMRIILHQPRPFVELAYGYLPLVLGGTLAHYLRLGLGEAGQLLPVTWATFGFSGTSLPIWVAHPAVIAFLQGTTLMAAILLTLLLTQKIARQSISMLVPQHVSTLVLGYVLWQTIV